MKKNITNLDLKNKTLIIRVDFNVPIHNGVITDDNRIKAALPTINYALEQGAKVILMSHLGKVKTESDLKTKSLIIVKKKLEEILKKEVLFSSKIEGSDFEEKINKLIPSQILLMENTRFADITNSNGEIDLEAKRESKNDPNLGKYWASLADAFINDAFGTSHREHASNVGIATHSKESALGFLVEKEVKMLGKALNKPSRPLVAIIGGAKVSDKINVIKNLLKITDKLIISGGMAYTFLKAEGYEIGKSLLEESKIPLAQEILNSYRNKILLPVDFAISKEFANTKPQYSKDENVPADFMGLDIGPKSLKIFKDIVNKAATVIWNGPLGVFEFSEYSKGTKGICEVISSLAEKAFTVIGGGDSAAAAIQLGFKDNFSHISTGGGASLVFMEGKDLPGISSIQDI